MSKIQKLEALNVWDVVDLSTAELRQQSLEILLCQKILKGEDTSQCFKALEYLKNSVTEQKLQEVFFQKVKQRLLFSSWHKTAIATLTLAGTLTFCMIVFYCFTSLQFDQYRSNLSIEKQIKDLKQKPLNNPYN